MTRLLLVALGGAIGSCLRYGVGLWAVQRLPAGFPWATLIVNVVGCLLIGFLFGLADDHALGRPELRALLVVGLLGGFTTFSSFGAETSLLARGGSLPLAAVNVMANVGLGLLAVMAGRLAARWF